jgi:hypothetical protein
MPVDKAVLINHRMDRANETICEAKTASQIMDYWILPKDTILMLLVYPKNEQDNLSSSQLKLLRSLVEKELQ